MQENSIIKILNKVSILSYVIAFSYLIYILVPRAYGIAIGISLISFTIFCFFYEEHLKIPNEIRNGGTTLLLYILMCVGSVILAFFIGKKFLFFCICCSFGGFIGIIKWFIEKKWKKKSLSLLLKEDFHILPPQIDIAIIVFNILDIVFGKGDLSVFAIVINSVLLLDVIIQLIIKHDSLKV